MSFFYDLKDSLSKVFSLSSKEGDYYNTIDTDEKDKIRKSKTVSFGEIHTIDVESYKLYNQSEELMFEDKENYEIKCCGINCKCGIY